MAVKQQQPLRSWGVSLIRRRWEFLGIVGAPDQESAEAEAVKEFELTDEQRKWLFLLERG
jgi:hypothetical protein